MALPSDAMARKRLPICNGVLDYFPNALADVSAISLLGNDQHNPGQPLHWSKEKSFDHPNTIVRHLMERGTIDIDNGRHSAKLAWRALANLEIEILSEQGDEVAIWIAIQIGTREQKARLKSLHPDKYAAQEQRVLEAAAAQKSQPKSS